MYLQPYYEHPSRNSRALFKDSGVFELFFNSRSDVRINSSESQKLIGKELQYLLRCDKYLCVVEPTAGSTRKSDFIFNTQFYCRLETLPSPEIMSEIPNLIKKCTVYPDFSE